MTSDKTAEIVIIGAGVSGLCCARRLVEAGRKPIILEASDGIGGRVRTDLVEGFRLDRGFQVLLTAYPEARAVLDYDALDLRPFAPGALVRSAGRFERVSDPWRQPSRLWSTLRARVGTLGDKLRLAKLRRAVRKGLGDETTTLEALRGFGFSSRMIDTLFRPWFGGVFLDPSLSASSTAFAYSFRMFSSGRTALPAEGMGAIPIQLAARLPEGTIRLETGVEAIDGQRLRLDGGEWIETPNIVIATEAPQMSRLLGEAPPPPGRGVRTLHFAADTPPVREPILVLNGDGQGPVNDLCVVSQVAPSYASNGRSLVSVTVLDEAAESETELTAAVCAQLGEWFGEAVADWRHLRTLRISHALPAQAPGRLRGDGPALRPGLYVCGDHREASSLQGAMLSGRRAAEAVLQI